MEQEPHPPSSAGERSASQSFLLLVGSLGPLGYMPASGTVAVAVAGIPLCWLLTTYLSPAVYALAAVLFAAAAIAIHHAGDRILGESDSRKLVWDELAGFFVAMFLIEWNWRIVAVAFFAERFVDIAKVPPANIVDRKMHNGLGVVLDDLIAGVYTCALLHALVYLLPTWFG